MIWNQGGKTRDSIKWNFQNTRGKNLRGKTNARKYVKFVIPLGLRWKTSKISFVVIKDIVFVAHLNDAVF